MATEGFMFKEYFKIIFLSLFALTVLSCKGTTVTTHEKIDRGIQPSKKLEDIYDVLSTGADELTIFINENGEAESQNSFN